MKLSARVLSKKFPPVKTGFLKDVRAYGQDDVDYFLQEIADEVQSLEKELETAKEQNEMLSSELQLGFVSPDGADEGDVETFQRKMEQVATLQKSFTRMIYNAELESAELKREAEKAAEKIELDAKMRAETLVNQATDYHKQKVHEADEIVNRAKEAVGEQLSQLASAYNSNKGQTSAS